MIHLLEIDPSLSLQEVKKLSRRYAMTGGYELSLAKGLTVADLLELVRLFGPELRLYQSADSQYVASNAFRIISLVRNHPCADIEVEKLAVSYLLSEDTDRNILEIAEHD